ncbi:MAG: helix-turn-helix domain-containing protein [Dysgonamonadaceae bacterium]|jgi:transcriptional regulator with XRE-family HTH domain|nr:helix-turn-helix domain-containing protein [Dysgonamonadaceae bacterium]
MESKAQRLRQIIDAKGFVTDSSFAEAVGIQPATLSHIFKGRNDISPRVIDKILAVFPDINPEWLRIGGTEPMFRKTRSELTLFPTNTDINAGGNAKIPNYSPEIGVNEGGNSIQKTLIQEVIREKIVSKKIVKITVFYDDNTFEDFLAGS